MGAPFTNGNNPREAAIHVFVRDGDGWSGQGRVEVPSSNLDAFLRFAVDVEGDVMVAGAQGFGSTGSNSPGGAFLFTRSGASWVSQYEHPRPPVDPVTPLRFRDLRATESPRGKIPCLGSVPCAR